jgi:hypothetical protein
VVALDLHHSTIREYLNCLRSGGIAISVGAIRTRYQVTGRPEATYQLQPPYEGDPLGGPEIDALADTDTKAGGW